MLGLLHETYFLKLGIHKDLFVTVGEFILANASDCEHVACPRITAAMQKAS